MTLSTSALLHAAAIQHDVCYLECLEKSAASLYNLYHGLQLHDDATTMPQINASNGVQLGERGGVTRDQTSEPLCSTYRLIGVVFLIVLVGPDCYLWQKLRYVGQGGHPLFVLHTVKQRRQRAEKLHADARWVEHSENKAICPLCSLHGS